MMVDNPAVAADFNVARHIAYSLTRMMSVPSEHNHPKTVKNIRHSYFFNLSCTKGGGGGGWDDPPTVF